MCQNKLLTLDFSKEEALTKVLPQLPILTSKEAGWHGIYLAYDRYQLPGKTPEFAAQQYGISIFEQVPQPIRAHRKLDGRSRYEQVVQGDVVIVPANTSHQVQWDTPGSVLMLGFEPTIFNYAIYEMVDPEKVALAQAGACPPSHPTLLHLIR